MTRDTLGEFEHSVLAVLLRLGNESYSMAIAAELEKRLKREVAQPAVYIALRRMEKKGLLRSRLDDHAIPKTGRQRRYFRLTAAGAHRLKIARETFNRIWEGLDPALLDKT